MIVPVLLPLVLALQGPGQVPARPSPDKVLARVNGAPITAAEIEPYLWDWKAFQVTQDIINSRLIRAEAIRRNVRVTPEEVKAQLKLNIDRLTASLQPGQTLDTVLLEQGGAVSRLALAVESQLLIEKLVALDFKPEDYVKVSTMVFKTSSETSADLAAAIKKADAAFTALKGGASWLKTLGQVETDRQILQNQGSVGWRPFTAFPPAAQTELKAGKSGTITHPVQTANGMQIFRIDAVSKEATEADRNELRQRFQAAAAPQLLARLRSEAKIERFFGP